MEHPWRVKLRQARRHMTTLRAQCDEYVAQANVGFEYPYDEEQHQIAVVLRADSDPPLLLGALVGDVLHNLRSALDAVAWATVMRYDPEPPRDGRGVYYPITESRAKWAERINGYLPGVPDHARTAFELCQPWYGPERRAAYAPTDVASLVGRDALMRLHNLAKDDRHRTVNPLLARSGPSWLAASEGTVLDALHADPAPWTVGSTVLRWQLAPGTSVTDVQPDGRALLVLPDEADTSERTALDALDAMHMRVVEATRRVEIDVLGIITAEDLDELGRLREEVEVARDNVRERVLSATSNGVDVVADYKRLTEIEAETKARYEQRARDILGEWE